MIHRGRVLWALLIALLIYPNDNLGGAFQPEFVAPIANLTVPLGRDALFTCLVEHLGGYRVGWVKADTKAIQAIHDHVITHNPRVQVSHSDHSTWNLHIRGVQLEDAGLYMCQINTDPMKFQTGMLSIEVPPDFVTNETSGDVMVSEGSQVKLTCRAKGVPQPRVNWKREDGKNIVIREPVVASNGQKSKVSSVSEYHGEELRLTKISRHDMGAYLCIASNGVPPAISKRITINVHFPPVIHVPNQLVGAPLGTDVALECFVEASPKSINYWMKDDDEMIISGTRHEVQAISKSAFQVKMVLTIRHLQKQDFGSYKCAAKNSRGDVDFSIRLYEISGPSRSGIPPPTYYDEEEDIDGVVYGSADIEKLENKAYAVDNTVQGHMGIFNGVSSPSPTIRVNRRRPITGTGSSPGNRLSSVSSNSYHRPEFSLVILFIAKCFL
ncbi:lachesin-like [Microplitis mediator]|uniref:lachesin-like n=1 Tax=Microplitis mediator TaxID=375433 RepID=UPI0025578493|nr:lachesin-like [Microplitis mediator]XP_057323489.1 lachesin-like [Microplitis mediator]XP_057323490.1 lachesin-like [Microplitis mediator]